MELEVSYFARELPVDIGSIAFILPFQALISRPRTSRFEIPALAEALPGKEADLNLRLVLLPCLGV